jgi:NCAIR mutase (PurE)-related protein
MAFDKDAGVTAGNADLPVARDAWVKPEILSFEPVSAAQGSGGLAGEGGNNVS